MSLALTAQVLLQFAVLKSINTGLPEFSPLAVQFSLKYTAKHALISAPSSQTASSLQPLPQLLVRTHLTQPPPSQYCHVNIST